MTYFVRAADGREYGPADVEQLNAWIAESRIGPDALLRPENSSATLAARTVPGLAFPEEALRRNQLFDRGGQEIRMAWLCLALSIVPCFRGINLAAPPFGIYLGWRALCEGAPRARLVMILNAAAFVVALGETLFLSRLVERLFTGR